MRYKILTLYLARRTWPWKKKQCRKSFQYICKELFSLFCYGAISAQDGEPTQGFTWLSRQEVKQAWYQTEIVLVQIQNIKNNINDHLKCQAKIVKNQKISTGFQHVNFLLNWVFELQLPAWNVHHFPILVKVAICIKCHF